MTEVVLLYPPITEGEHAGRRFAVHTDNFLLVWADEGGVYRCRSGPGPWDALAERLGDSVEPSGKPFLRWTRPAEVQALDDQDQAWSNDVDDEPPTPVR